MEEVKELRESEEKTGNLVSSVVTKSGSDVEKKKERRTGGEYWRSLN